MLITFLQVHKNGGKKVVLNDLELRFMVYRHGFRPVNLELVKFNKEIDQSKSGGD